MYFFSSKKMINSTASVIWQFLSDENKPFVRSLRRNVQLSPQFTCMFPFSYRSVPTFSFSSIISLPSIHIPLFLMFCFSNFLPSLILYFMYIYICIYYCVYIQIYMFTYIYIYLTSFHLYGHLNVTHFLPALPADAAFPYCTSMYIYIYKYLYIYVFLYSHICLNILIHVYIYLLYQYSTWD